MSGITKHTFVHQNFIGLGGGRAIRSLTENLGLHPFRIAGGDLIF